ncbi:MAG: pantoate--beta-alanine ligase, partial [Schwartzia sp.]|nr:pantoate--beta-alanine ligase [Schwartzia sp. (in: firmicutes)]
LQKGKAAFDGGEKGVETLKKIVRDEIGTEPTAVIDYVDIYSFPALLPIAKVEAPALLAIAVKIGKTRLIDNMILGE